MGEKDKLGVLLTLNQKKKKTTRDALIRVFFRPILIFLMCDQPIRFPSPFFTARYKLELFFFF